MLNRTETGYHFFLFHIKSSINGVKEMHGFRNAFNITFNQKVEDNQTYGAQCASTDDVETSALMVCTIHCPQCPIKLKLIIMVIL